MTDKEIAITYDLLYDLLRREKNNGEIQKLSEDFFQQLLSYLLEKQVLLKEEGSDPGLFGFEEKRKLMQQLENAYKIITDLYEWREKKIVLMARDVSRTNESIANTSSLLGQEKELYDEILAVLNKFRKNILISLLSGKQPFSDAGSGCLSRQSELIADTDMRGEEPKALNMDIGLSSTNTAKIRFKSGVPPFMGPDMKEYGPYDSDQVQELPIEIADLMIRRGCAEKIEG